jgi:hypothetical protein
MHKSFLLNSIVDAVDAMLHLGHDVVQVHRGDRTNNLCIT